MAGTQDLASLIARLEVVVGRFEKIDSKAGPKQASEEESAAVTGFDELLSGSFKSYVAASDAIGGVVQEHAAIFAKSMNLKRNLIALASKSRKPTNQTLLAELLKPLSENILAMQEFPEKNRKAKEFNHMKAISEGVAALGWVAVEPKPVPYVSSTAESSEFYGNRVRKEYKGEQVHQDWVTALYALWKALTAYVKEYHTTGLAYNPKGVELKAGASIATPSTAAAGPPAPPPPAPGPPPPGPPPPPAASAAPAVDPSALFADINKGGDVTKGLKRVTDDMKTHKNPALRSGPAPFKKPATAPKPGSVSKPVAAKPAATVSKPPKVVLNGKKWEVEYLTDNTSTVIDETNNKQTVYVYKCVNSTVQIKGKINSVTLDGCKKTAVVLDDAISMVEFINCQSVKVQVLGKVPTVSIEKTDGCQVYLSANSLDTSFISAKSSEMNVVIPTKDGDYTEYAIAEQFRTTFNGKTLVTEVNDIAA